MSQQKKITRPKEKFYCKVQWLALCHALLNDDWLIDWLIDDNEKEPTETRQMRRGTTSVDSEMSAVESDVS